MSVTQATLRVTYTSCSGNGYYLHPLHVQVPFYDCSDVQTYLSLGLVLGLVLGLGL